jgi:hypothetical protein
LQGVAEVKEKLPAVFIGNLLITNNTVTVKASQPIAL